MPRVESVARQLLEPYPVPLTKLRLVALLCIHLHVHEAVGRSLPQGAL